MFQGPLVLHYNVLPKPKQPIEEKEKEMELFKKHMKRLKPSEPIRKPPAKEEDENGNAK